MGVVEVCPKNQVDITTASKKLGCKNDTYGNNRYMCVPKEDKASLFEFCYDGNMGIEEGGKRFVQNGFKTYIYIHGHLSDLLLKKSWY